MIFAFLCLITSLSIISRSIQVAENSIISFFFVAEWYSVIYLPHISFIHSSVSEHLACFHVLAIVNSVAISIGVHISFQIMVFSRYIPRSGLAWSRGNPLFSFLRNLHTVLHSGYTNLHSHQQCRMVPFSPHLHQHLFFMDFLMMVILIEVMWKLM